MSRDIKVWELNPVQAAIHSDIELRAHQTGHMVYVRAIVHGRERHSWYVSPDNADVIADALELHGKSGGEVRKSADRARIIWNRLLESGELIIDS